MQILLYSTPSIYCINFLFDFSEINIYSIWGWNLQKQLFLKASACIIFWYWCLDIDGFWILVIWEPPCWKVQPMIGLLSMIGMPSMIGPCRRLLPVHLINDTRGPDTGHKHQGCTARETDQLTWTKMINHQDVHPMWPLEFRHSKFMRNVS